MHDVDAELVKHMQEAFQCNGEIVRQLNERLSQNGVSVYDVTQGCIEVTFTCDSIQSLHNFRDLYDSGKLQDMLNETFINQLAKRGVSCLNVDISHDQFEKGAEMFSDWFPMTLERRQALLSSLEWLVGKIKVCGDLLDKMSLCDRRRQAIECAETHEEQVETLIDIVSRQPDSAFEQLLNALKATNQTEAADIITETHKEDLHYHPGVVNLMRKQLPSRHRTDIGKLKDELQAAMSYSKTLQEENGKLASRVAELEAEISEEAQQRKLTEDKIFSVRQILEEAKQLPLKEAQSPFFAMKPQHQQQQERSGILLICILYLLLASL